MGMILILTDRFFECNSLKAILIGRPLPTQHNKRHRNVRGSFAKHHGMCDLTLCIFPNSTLNRFFFVLGE